MLKYSQVKDKLFRGNANISVYLLIFSSERNIILRETEIMRGDGYV